MTRTRIAPAPTGKFHIGTARAALFNYLFAKQSGGVFVLRIEDTDKVRSKKEFEDDILESLKWLGLAWDEFYRQSERISMYRTYLEKLLEQGRAFYCYHSSEETKGGVHFCEYREGSNQRMSNVKCQMSNVIRFKTPKDREVEFDDIVRGKVRFNTNEIGDFSIAKSLDEPLWILAVTADDYEMGITHVIRGEDHISNTPKQILLQESLGFLVPEYAHLPLILGPDRSKLSKRHGATSVSEFRSKGYLAEAFINFIALLGWNPGDEREFFSLEDLIKEFSLKRVKKGPAVFNLQRLGFMNQHYLRSLPLEVVSQRAKEFFKKVYGDEAIKNFKKLQEIVALERERAKTLEELAKALDFIFKLPDYESSLLHWRNQASENVKENLQKAFQIVEKIPPGSYVIEYIKEVFFEEIEKGGGESGELLWPFRVSLSGKKASPGPFEIAAALGGKETLKRIRYAIQKISSH
ncbi:MAG: glutamate--tRNA ligase [Candidatus Portnoybacteria bacterium]|nr:glutamate--tRNA ligase [Candidatus Portnoybacteria bacterium]